MIITRDSAYPTVEVSSSDVQKCGILHFCQKKDHGYVFICFLFVFFRRGDYIEPVILEDPEKAHLIGDKKF